MNAVYAHACFLFLNAYQVPLGAADVLDTPSEKLQKATRSCESLGSEKRAYCFEGIGNSSVLFGYRDTTGASIQSLCDELRAESDRMACTLGIVEQLLFTDAQHMYGYCADIAEESRKALCYEAVFQLHLSDDSDQFAQVCQRNKVCSLYKDAYERNRATLPDYRYGLFGRMDGQ
jgi:hypothetical protein